jgi:hypothetical protein
VERLPRLQRRERRPIVERRDLLDRRLLLDDGVVAPGNPRSREIGVPVEARRERLQLGDAHRVVDLVDVAAVGRRPARLRHGGLEREHRVGVLRRVRVADHAQRALDVGAIGVELRLERGCEVVIAIGQAEARLTEEQRVRRGVRRIGGHAGAHQRQAERAVGLAHESRERVLVGECGHALQIRLQRLVVARLDRGFVHEAAIHAAERAGRRRLLDDGANLRLRPVEDVEADAGGRLVGRDLGPPFPAAVDELIEILGGLGRAIHRRQVHAPGSKPRRRLRRPRRLRRAMQGDGAERDDGEHACGDRCVWHDRMIGQRRRDTISLGWAPVRFAAACPSAGAPGDQEEFS